MDQIMMIRQKLQQELLRKKGNLVLDFENPEHRDYYFAQLGLTREEAEQRCPKLYQAVQSAPKQSENESIESDDYQDQYKLFAMLEEKRGEIHSFSQMATIQSHHVLSTYCYSYNDSDDPNHIHPLSADNGYIKNASQLDNHFQTPPYRVSSPKQFSSVVTYTITEKGNIKSSQIRTSKTLLLPQEAFVTKAEIFDPVRRFSGQPGQVIVCYNRTATPEEKADYVYLQAKPVVDTKGNTTIPVYMPFSGAITVNSDFTEINYDKSLTEFSLSIMGQTGTCRYNFTGLDYSKVFTIDNSSHTISWTLRKQDPVNPGKDLFNYENWNVNLDAERVFNNTKVSFYAKIALILKDEDDNYFVPDVVFSSPYAGQVKSASTVRVDAIVLWWGCLGGDTVVTLAGGIQKKLSDLVSGDQLMLEDGTCSEVECMVNGTEKTVICLETQSGNVLEASDEHPILTKRGMMRAKDLHAGDQIRTQTGWELLSVLCRKDWNRAVYSPKLTHAGCFFASGILAGDFDTQQGRLPYECSRREWCPYESVPMEDELTDFLAQRKPVGVHNWIVPTKPYYACGFSGGEGYARVRMKDADGIPEESFSLALWMYVTGQSRSILSQQGGFCIGLDADTLLISTSEGKIFEITPGISMRATWIQVFLSFDGAQLTVGINGMPIDFFDAAGDRFFSKEDLLLGEHFTGYLRQVVIYSRCIGADLLRLRMFQNVASRDQEGLFCMVDASDHTLDDIGPNRFTVLANAACGQRVLVDGYHPGKGHSARLEGAQINPGGAEDFSIYVKCYLLPPKKASTVLCSNGSLGDADAWALVAEKTDKDHVRIAVWYGTQHYTVVESAAVQEWHDFVFTYQKGSSRLSAYYDEDQVQDYFSVPCLNRKHGNLRIGNGFDKDDSQDYTAEALFTAVAIFCRALHPDEAQAFSQEQPFLLEQGLEALFLFEGGQAYEAVSGRKVFAGAEEQVLQPQTLSTITPVHYWYDIHTDTQSYSKKADVLYKVFCAWMQSMFGLSCDAVNMEYHDAICTQMESRLMNQPPIQELLDGQTDDAHLRACLKAFSADLSTYLTLTFANHPYNRRKSNLANKLGINHVIASASALSWATQYAITFKRSTVLPNVYSAMRKAMQAEV